MFASSVDRDVGGSVGRNWLRYLFQTLNLLFTLHLHWVLSWNIQQEKHTATLTTESSRKWWHEVITVITVITIITVAQCWWEGCANARITLMCRKPVRAFFFLLLLLLSSSSSSSSSSGLGHKFTKAKGHLCDVYTRKSWWKWVQTTTTTAIIIIII